MLDNTSIKNIFSHPRYGKPVSSAIINRIIEEKTYLLEQLVKRERIWGLTKVGKVSWIRIFEILREL